MRIRSFSLSPATTIATLAPPSGKLYRMSTLFGSPSG